jgi:hypothetical protein
VVGEGEGDHKPTILHGEGSETHGKSRSGQEHFPCQEKLATRGSGPPF